ncbi:helix-turn-helix domain-containing protein [Caballeronia sp. 15711]|uniref:helix-turn-helix domain-containing protein n=1 Tax=Caballeronia sp. 15711 TaxID=3391029 RepID=UPI0039E680A6
MRRRCNRRRKRTTRETDGKPARGFLGVGGGRRNKSHAAVVLGISRRALYRLLATKTAA